MTDLLVINVVLLSARRSITKRFVLNAGIYIPRVLMSVPRAAADLEYIVVLRLTTPIAIVVIHGCTFWLSLFRSLV